MRPFEARKCSFEMSTGAATTRFCVKTAAAEAGTSLEISARSSAPVFLRPQAVAAKRNPLGSADSGGGWVISQWLPWAGGFPAQRWRRERGRARFRPNFVGPEGRAKREYPL